MLSERARDIFTIAQCTAEERSGVARLVSFMGTKTHKWKKPGNVVKTAASGGGAAIPVPGVSIATDYIVGKVADKLRSKSHEQKKRKYDLQAANKPDDPAARMKKMKFDVKDLDVKHLQESLRKVRNQLEQMKNPGKGPSECHRAFQTAYRYHRALHRLDKLRLEAEAMVAVGEELVKYCKEQEDAIESRWDEVTGKVEAHLAHPPESCPAGPGCYNGPNGEQRLRRDAEKRSKVELP